MSSPLTPYSQLTPDCLLDALEAAGFRTDGRLLALNSFENRVYQVGIEDSTPVVAKFYRPHRWTDDAIHEEHAFLRQLAEAEIPVVAPLANAAGETLFHAEGFRFAVFPRRGGRSPELDNPETLTWLGRFIGRIHAIGRQSRYHHRPTLSPQTFGTHAIEQILDSGFVPADKRGRWQQSANRAMEAIEALYEKAGDIELIRLHGDCHPSNVLWTDDGPHFVDFDDSRMGPAVQDLWMLVTGAGIEQQHQLTDILVGYEDFCEFNWHERHLIEALRTLRQIHYAAWLSQRWSDPAFPAAFPWFGEPHYWDEHTQALEQQVLVMQEKLDPHY
ncbi:serine/threonine protein kinase [Leeia oryzae]|uniref:serine/threonine protein kinase n=1 Tax=Leeia oryzae TaxID=356662 RepID=UPI0003656F52|nr:serine/threonine protein kinase [Leeia oryzae]